jgi:hypothetical protein
VNCARCQEILDTDGIEPDCENCDLPILIPENQRIWELYETINTQFVHDFNALPLVFENFGIQATQKEAKEILNKLITIHGVITDHGRQKQNVHNPGSR